MRSTRTGPRRRPPTIAELDAEDPAAIIFTSGTSGDRRASLYPQRYLTGQRLQAEHWVGARKGELAWCTAAPGWSKSTRNVFIAPWLAGPRPLIHDAPLRPRRAPGDRRARGRQRPLPGADRYRMLAKRTELRPIARCGGCSRRASRSTRR